jgi:hypothetical protein
LAFTVPRLSYKQIQSRAAGFLQSHNPDGDIPVPIEDIMDVKLGINIIPFPGLVDFDVDAYTWSDMRNIVVDQHLYEKPHLRNRFRFTLAHEMGHIELHSAILQSAQVDSIKAYFALMDSMTEEDRRWENWHANCFAGLVLVPAQPLNQKLQEANSMAKVNGLSPDAIEARGYIADWISDYFEVSAQCIETRLVHERLWPKVERREQERS